MNISVWDFGGATIYVRVHITLSITPSTSLAVPHLQNSSNRFLSSAGSVFLLCFDIRDEDYPRRVEFWMHTIKVCEFRLADCRPVALTLS